MASDMTSMLKALLEAQEREMTWNPTGHHGFESSSTYQDELLNGNFPPVNQYGYGESCQSWNMAHHYGATYPSPIPNEEEMYNMLKLLLEGQEACNKMLRDQTWIMEPDHGEAHSSPISNEEENYNLLKLMLEEQDKFNKRIQTWDWNHDLKVAAPTHEENAQIKDEFLTQLNEDDNISNHGVRDESMAEEDERAIEDLCRLIDDTSVENLVVESDVGVQQSVENIDVVTQQSKDEFLEEAEKTVAEFELLLGCTVDENLVLRYEDPCDDGLVSECLDNERMHMQLICQQVIEGAKPKEKAEIHIEEATNEGGTELSPLAQPFDKHLDIVLTHEVRFHDPWKIPFEEIRMKEFRGWFYDEYDPGDRIPCYTPL